MSDSKPPAPKAYVELQTRLREVATLHSVRSLLGWDQETMMPPGAAEFRAEQLSLVATLAHRRLTDTRMGALVEACESDRDLMVDEGEKANLREIRRDYDRARKLPETLVAEISVTSSRALEVWKRARQDNDFAAFRPWLQKQVELNRRKAECYGTPEGGELYDALLDEFEPGMKSADIEQIFRPLREALAPMIAGIVGKPGPDTTPLRVKLPVDRQKEFNRFVAERVGFDFESGRLDVSTHPFTEGLAPGDTRITTRYAEDHFTEALGSTLHETGHALYEQGLPKQSRHGEPLAQPTSLGIHESQSRLWENQVGRSKAFWTWALPEAKRVFGAALEPFSASHLHGAVNRVEPSLIRVESDETTYNLHIMLRFDIERALIRDHLAAADVPSAWNARVEQDLGLDVPDDRRGCLQDIHWSVGSFGYFPTYTLGNLYAAQLWEKICRDIPDLEPRLSRGEFGGLLDWLRENVHAHGRRFGAAELCERITGSPLGHEPLIRNLRAKLASVYAI